MLNVLEMNPLLCRLFDRAPDAMRGRPLASLIMAPDRAALGHMAERVNEEKPWQGLMRASRPDGSAIDLEWLVSNRLPSGQVLCIVTDITERNTIEQEREKIFLLERSAREEAERLSQVKDEFLATLAHELRNPLAPLRNALHVMEMSPQDGPAQVKMRELMDRQVRQMARLIDDLMDVSRITRGLVELKRERVPLESVINAAIELSAPLIASEKHTLNSVIETPGILIDIDPLRGAQIFANLLNNAAKYTPPGGRIALHASVAAGVAEVSIQDNGIGIPPAMRERIFDMFTQVPQTGDRSAGGLGIGLTLVRRLIEMHGGSIEVRSAGLGAGSAFTVRLPLESGDVTHVAMADQDLPGASAGAGQRVVVIDDNRDITDSLCELLSLFGYEATACNDGSEGIATVARVLPHFVFVDIGMPSVSGYEVVARIRATAAGQHMKLIAMTGWGQPEDRRRSREAGFDVHLVKPVGMGELRAALGADAGAG